jgi:hypothetical protein
MGRIVVSENVSLDGVIQDPAGVEGFNRGDEFLAARWPSRLVERNLGRLVATLAADATDPAGTSSYWTIRTRLKSRRFVLRAEFEWP